MIGSTGPQSNQSLLPTTSIMSLADRLAIMSHKIFEGKNLS